MFQRTAGSRVCFDCKETEEQAYRLVRDFLERHKQALAARVSREVLNKLETGLKNPRR